MDGKQAAACARAARLIKAELQPGKKASAQQRAQPNTPSCRLMFTGNRRKGCGVRSLLTEHSCANGCHRGSLSIAGSQQTPLFPDPHRVVGTARPTALPPGGIPGAPPPHLWLPGLTKKACLAPQSSLHLVPTVQTCSEITAPGNQRQGNN